MDGHHSQREADSASSQSEDNNLAVTKLDTTKNQKGSSESRYSHYYSEDESHRQVRAIAAWFSRKFGESSLKDVVEIVLGVLIFVVGVSAAVIYNGQLEEMKHTNELTQESIFVSQRPWVSLEEHIAGGLEFQKDLAEITLIHTANNQGITPAINARTDFELVELQRVRDTQRHEDITEAERFCNTLLPSSEGKTDEWILVNRQTIFPKVPTQTESFAGVVTHPIGNDKVIMPLVISCVVYQSSFTHDWYRTWKIYSIMVPSKGPQHYAFPSSEKDIPQANLVLMPWIHPDHSN